MMKNIFSNKRTIGIIIGIIVVAIIFIFVVGILFYSHPADNVRVNFIISPQEVSIIDSNKEGNISSYIDATVERSDDINKTYVFVLRFSNTANCYAVDNEGKQLTELPTEPLRSKNSKSLIQFKIFATKGDAITSTYNLNISLWQNNTIIDSKIIKINVS